MKAFVFRILLIEDNAADAELIREMAAEGGGRSSLQRSHRLSSGLELLERESFDIVLLDLGLPDSGGLETLRTFQQKQPKMPVIVLTGFADEEMASKAISLGAQDYLVKGQIDGNLLLRSIRYSIERKQVEKRLIEEKGLSEALNRINELIHSTLDIEAIMQKIIFEAAKALNADGSSIGLLQADTIFMKYAYNMPPDFTGNRFSVTELKSINHAISKKDAFAYNEISGYEQGNYRLWEKYGIHSLLVAPLIIRNDVVGALSIYSMARPFTFTEVFVDFARKLAASVSLALENAQLFEQGKRMEDEMRHMAHHDFVTGLPNRRLFMEVFHLEMAQARRNQKRLALLFLDLDRFKEINDTLGHEAGDELLVEVAKRLKTTIRESDTVARIGGDEFNILLADISRTGDITNIVRKIMGCFHKSHFIAGHEIHMTTSIGISVYPDDGEEMDTLFRYADIAMYHAKEKGRNVFQFYDPAMNIRSVEKMKLEGYLRQAITRNELVVHYQPQIDIRSNKIICAEALVRWNHPELGLLGPKRFIPLAEETGFITAIDEWVLQAACDQVKTWNNDGLPFHCITVNLSARQFQSPELVQKISRILEQSGIPPAYLDIEITESMAMSDINRTAVRLKELSNMGIHISIDDFGTGYSSLNYLKRLPIGRLKIDRSFVQDIATDPDDRAIISAVTAMGHNMRMTVLAEGVETEDQLSFLHAADCDEVQGFLFSKPLPPEKFREFVSAGI